MSDRLRILHLAFEDYRRPGSGGGGIRTHEVDRRLARRHEVTVVTTRYPGSEPRTEDGVHYRHAGANLGHFGSIVTYFMTLPWLAWRSRADLIVEDFAAPASSYLVPLWTRRPTVAVVQWMFARDKARQYRLPVHLLENLGTKMHRDFVVVAEPPVARIRELNPEAEISVIGNGVDEDYLGLEVAKVPRIVYLGRLESDLKGIEMLFAAIAGIDELGATLVVAGDGPDESVIRALATELGLGDRVEFVGRVTGPAKAELLASALVVCMPSRFEMNPIVALEAMACRTAVLAFDIPAFSEMSEVGGVITVPAFDVDAYRDALAALVSNRDECTRIGTLGRAYASGRRWDDVAAHQEAVYRRAVARGGRKRSLTLRAAFRRVPTT